jgi:hypothetical protein
MSRSFLSARVERLEVRHASGTTRHGLVVVWLDDGETRALALQKAGLTPAAIADTVVLYVQYEEACADAL